MSKSAYEKVNALASRVALKGGKKSQASIGDIREILGILSDIVYENYVVSLHLYDYGKSRAKALKAEQ